MRGFASLRRRSDFARVARRGRRRAGQFLTCLVADGQGRSRVGLTVSGQVGGAVVRNLVRRRLKAILDGYALATLPARDIVFIARPGAGELTYSELFAEVERTFGALP
jgi:ribonuclease P protein component